MGNGLGLLPRVRLAEGQPDKSITVCKRKSSNGLDSISCDLSVSTNFLVCSKAQLLLESAMPLYCRTGTCD